MQNAHRSHPGTGLPDLVIAQGCRHQSGERGIVGPLGDESLQGLTAFTPLQVSIVEYPRDDVAGVWTGHDKTLLFMCVAVTALTSLSPPPLAARCIKNACLQM